METLLSRQLQQAWLQTQIRKQNPSDADPSPSPTSHDNSWTSSESVSASPDICSSISSSSIVSSPTECWLSAAASGLNKQLVKKPNGESYRDPVLQYINDMLMEEEMEDRVCMMQECTSYQATVKELSDILDGGDNQHDIHCNDILHGADNYNEVRDGADNYKDGAGYNGDCCNDIFHSADNNNNDGGLNDICCDDGYQDCLDPCFRSLLPSSEFRVSGIPLEDYGAQDPCFRSLLPSNEFRVSGTPCDDCGAQCPCFRSMLPSKEFRVSGNSTWNVAVADEFDGIDDIVNQWINDVPENSAATMVSTPAADSYSSPWSCESSASDPLYRQGSTNLSRDLLCCQQSFDSSSPDSGNYISHQSSFKHRKSFNKSDESNNSVHGQSARFAQNGLKENGNHRSVPELNEVGLQNGIKENGNPGTAPGLHRVELRNGNGNHKSVLEPNPAKGVAATVKHLTRPMTEAKQVPDKRGTNTIKMKRSALEVDSAVEGLKWSRSLTRPQSANGGSTANMDSKIDEVVSFVKNMRLNAEKCGQLLNDGKPFVSEKVCTTADGHKRPWKTTTAVDLKSLLISCAQAVAAENIGKAHEILKEIRLSASPFGDGQQRLAHYFAEGFVARLSRTGGRLYTAFTNNAPSAAKILKAHHLFVQVSPFEKVSHYFANKAIFEAAKGASELHVIDYGILYGLQWPCLISALAQRKGGPPHLRITGIDFPQPGTRSAERVDMTGRRLAEFARSCGVPFQYQAIANKWENVQPSDLHLKKEEVLIVNSMYRLRHLLDETVLASNPRKTVLSKIRSLKPQIFVQGVRNGNFNTPFFMSRFSEALSFFSSEFDMIDVIAETENQERMMFEREVLGRDILNVIACEGPERIERPETYQQWQNRTNRAGFQQLPLDQVVVREARDIVKNFYHKDFSVDEDGRWMLLGWKGHALNALSLWKPV